jgi:hypothetical protein
MNKLELSDTIKQLKEIKPRQEWVSLLRSEILTPAENKAPVAQNDIFVAEKKDKDLGYVSDVMSQRRFAYASATFVFMVVAFLGFARYTMPGDALYPIKKVAEQQIQTPLKIAQNRSDELIKIVKENKTQEFGAGNHRIQSKHFRRSEKPYRRLGPRQQQRSSGPGNRRG